MRAELSIALLGKIDQKEDEPVNIRAAFAIRPLLVIVVCLVGVTAKPLSAQTFLERLEEKLETIGGQGNEGPTQAPDEKAEGTRPSEATQQPIRATVITDAKELGRNTDLIPYLGLQLEEFDKAKATRGGIPVSSGVMVSTIDRESPADAAGIPVQSVIVAMDGRRIDELEDVQFHLSTKKLGEQITVLYYSGPQLHRANVMVAGLQVPRNNRRELPTERPRISNNANGTQPMQGPLAPPLLQGPSEFGEIPAPRSADQESTPRQGDLTLNQATGGGLLPTPREGTIEPQPDPSLQSENARPLESNSPLQTTERLTPIPSNGLGNGMGVAERGTAERGTAERGTAERGTAERNQPATGVEESAENDRPLRILQNLPRLRGRVRDRIKDVELPRSEEPTVEELRDIISQQQNQIRALEQRLAQLEALLLNGK